MAEPLVARNEVVLATGVDDVTEEQIVDTQGRPLTVMTKKSLYVDPSGKRHVVGVVRDITERKQAEHDIRLNEARLASLLRISQYSSANVQDLLDFALDEAIQLTGSKIGYIYHYHEDRREFVLNTWSKGVMDQCGILEKQTVYALDKTGIWGEAVRQRRPILINDYEAPNPLKKGCPQGHAPLHKYMTVPVFNGHDIVAVVGVANKATDYDQADVRQLTLLMDSVLASRRSKAGGGRLAGGEDQPRSHLRILTGGNAGPG